MLNYNETQINNSMFMPFEKLQRCAIYARVSTAEQTVDGYSIDGQIANVESYVLSKGGTVVKVYTDRGITGTSIEKRAALKRMLEDVKLGMFDTVVIWKTSRLARKNRDLLNIVYELEKNAINLISISDNIDSKDKNGKIMLNMMGFVAEMERDGIVENVKLGMTQRALEGYKNGGKMLGYRSEGKGKEVRLVIDESEALLVRLIYDMYLEGKGYKAIANKINNAGYRTIKGNLFAVNQISDILSNPTYTGLIRFNQFTDWEKKRRKGRNKNPIIVEGRHEAIIDRDKWEQVQEIKNRKGMLNQRGPRNGKFPLTGLIKCPECGASMACGGTTATRKDGSKRRTDYYVCGRFSNKGSAACHANSVRAEDANEYVYEKIQTLFNNENVIKELVKEYNNKNESLSVYVNHKNVLEKKLAEIENRRNRIFAIYEDNTISRDELRQRLSKLTLEKEQLEEEIGTLNDKIRNNKVAKVSFKTVQKAMGNFAKMINDADPDKRKLLLEMVILKITVNPDRRVDSINIRLTSEACKFARIEQEEEPSSEDSSSFIFEAVI